MTPQEAIETCRKLAKGFYNKKNMDPIRVGNELEAVRSVLVVQEREVERMKICGTCDLVRIDDVDGGMECEYDMTATWLRNKCDKWRAME